MYMHTNTYMHVATIIEKHTVNFKESKEEYMRVWGDEGIGDMM